jgi:RNA polymerase sigma-70 factor (ECF subfamily)
MALRSGNANGPLPVVPEQAGSDGIESLYRRYKDRIRRRIASQFGAGPPDPEDAVQAAFERFAKLEDRDRVQDPEAFLIRTAANFVLDHRRRMKVRAVHADNEFHLGVRTDDFDAERVFSGKERLAIIDRAIRAMDERRREVLIMNRIHGVSCADIARHLNRSPTLVKMLLAEAIILCERALREAGAE